MWKITKDQGTITTSYGKVHGKKQSNTKEYDSEEKVEKEWAKLIKAKEKKGYVLGTEPEEGLDEPAPKQPKKKRKAVSKKSKKNGKEASKKVKKQKTKE
jgi:predicted DNA-binding WGR domain protein